MGPSRKASCARDSGVPGWVTSLLGGYVVAGRCGRSSVRPPAGQVGRARRRIGCPAGFGNAPRGGRRPASASGGWTSEIVGWRSGFRGANPPARTSAHEMGCSGPVRATHNPGQGLGSVGCDGSWWVGTRNCPSLVGSVGVSRAVGPDRQAITTRRARRPPADDRGVSVIVMAWKSATPRPEAVAGLATPGR